MFVSIKFSDKEGTFVMREPSEEKIKKKIDEFKTDYDVREKNRIKDRHGNVKAIIYSAKRKPHYIWE